MAEIALGHLRVDDFLDQRLYVFFGILFQTARTGLYGIAHHQYRLLTRKGIWPGIVEGIGRRLPLVAVLPADVEILGAPLAVVRADEVADHGGQVVFVGQLQALGDVADDDARAAFLVETVVRIHAALVLREEGGVAHLADVVVECAGTHELRLCSDFVGHLCREVRHLQGMDKRALRHLRHAAQNTVVGIGKLHERHAGGEAESLFDEIEQGVGKELEHAADDNIYICRHVEHVEVDALRQFARHHRGKLYHGDGQGHAHQLRALRKFAQGVDGHEAAHHLHAEELIGRVQRDARQQEGDHRRKERRARVHEDAHEHRHDDIGHHVDAVEHVLHQRVGHQREHGDEAEHQEDAVGRGEIVAAEEFEVAHEGEAQQGHEEHLPEYRGPQPFRRAAAAVALALERLQYLVLLGTDDFAPVDDALPALHHAAGRRHGCDEVAMSGVCLGGVAGKVGGEIGVDVAAGEDFAGEMGGVGRHDVFVGRARGENVVRAALHCFRAADDAHSFEFVAREFGHGLVGHDAARINLVQELRHMGGVGRGYVFECVRAAGLFKGFELVLAGIRQPTEKGQEVLGRAVTLCLQLLCGLVDGEIVRGNQRRIAPRTIQFVLVAELALARHEIGERTDGEQQHQCHCHAAAHLVAALFLCIPCHSEDLFGCETPLLYLKYVRQLHLERIGLEIHVLPLGNCASQVVDFRHRGRTRLAEGEVVAHAHLNVAEHFETCADVPRGYHVLLLKHAVVVGPLGVANAETKLRAGGEIHGAEFAETNAVTQVHGNFKTVIVVRRAHRGICAIGILNSKTIGIINIVAHIHAPQRILHGGINAETERQAEINLRTDKPAGAVACVETGLEFLNLYLRIVPTARYAPVEADSGGRQSTCQNKQ